MPNDQNQNNDPAAIKKLDPAARRQARIYALQAIYQWQLANAEINQIEKEFITYQINRKTDIEYFKKLIQGVYKDFKNIDASMQPYFDRPQFEIDPVELAVLRIAVFELIECLDVPYRVIINEALELTKKFGSVEGFKFINGVLDRTARKIRATEVGMK